MSESINKQAPEPTSATLDITTAISEMLLVRTVEEQLLELFSTGKLAGTTHTSIGQEISAVGVITALRRDIDFVFSNHRCHGHYLAYGAPLAGLLGEIMGLSSGICGGRGGSQHICHQRFFSNGIQGGMMPIACGTALSQRQQASDAIACVFLGDGTMGEGTVYESFNLASLWKLPVLFVIEDNGVAQTTDKRSAVAGSIAERPRAFGIETVHMQADDVLQVHRQAYQLVEQVRAGRGPCCLILETFRLAPHSKGDDHRDVTALKKAREADPLNRLMAQLPAAQRDELTAAAMDHFYGAVASAEQAQRPFSDETFTLLSEAKPSRFQLPTLDQTPRLVERLNQGLHAAMAQDESVLLIGEDILDPYGGAFKASKGLSDRFPERVLTTPISEATIVGLGTGAAMTGCQPIVEIMFGDFCTLITDQLVNHAAKLSWMYNKQVKIPLLVRTPMGGRRGYGPTHSQSIERLFLGVPGLRVAALTGYADPAETLLTCLSQDDPVLLIENKLAYGKPLPSVPQCATLRAAERPLGPVRIGVAQAEVTLLTYGGMDEITVAALASLYEEEIAVEVIIAQQISPIEGFYTELFESVSRTGRLVVCEEGTGPWGFGAEVCALIGEQLANSTTALQMTRIAARCCPIPSSPALEEELLPDTKHIVDAVTRFYLC